ncbi:NUMOD1 domain-containing DNA-binding protein [Burkholderia sp. SR8]|uniref:NUMOD1 domain-containing DNA-binding protein n=1 Tax=Burkholderia sp. SR8 TaxID=3062277 RepID=UPI004064430F
MICVETGVSYPSIAEAARSTGLSQGNISAVLAGKRRLAGGCRWTSPEDVVRVTQEPLRPRRLKTKAVRCIDTNEVFPSVSDAARAKNISNSHICSVCKGHRQTAGGLHWQYANAF